MKSNYFIILKHSIQSNKMKGAKVLEYHQFNEIDGLD